MGPVAIRSCHGLGRSFVTLSRTRWMYVYCGRRGSLPTAAGSIYFQGVTALHLAVYKYEEIRSLEVINFLLAHGANISLKAAVPPCAHKISIIRHGKKDTIFPMETKKISLDQKTPLLVALELKSTLYLRGMYSLVVHSYSFSLTAF